MSFTPAAHSVEIVEKEDLTTMHFAPEDVLTDEAARQRRRADAERAATLGNAYHGKLDIYFQTADGATKRVATTIWAADADHLTLKSGASLPMRAVLGFDFY
ncbi:hypothetical protein Q3A66_05960 [Hymenobacter sp. BT770]|uniref:hypothetical protein n=1 Tax=Hymenobacter sp. BT770 TaxID=2886942 RepID=UPI001D11B8F6|nr:hypothetical protein [Hymenobacter sp. BT770]MCC3152419.1 hypothetical protein [Hymenobacter sp. BT770]MDO3414605.1 hypothetical protein [Hymenobacter sp. BT770]